MRPCIMTNMLSFCGQILLMQNASNLHLVLNSNQIELKLFTIEIMDFQKFALQSMCKRQHTTFLLFDVKNEP